LTVLFDNLSLGPLWCLSLGLGPFTSYSFFSPNHHLLFAAHAHTIAACSAAIPMLCHLYLVSLSSLLGNLSFSLTPHIHLTILISALTVSQNDNTNRTKAVKSNIAYKVVTANNTHTQYYWSYSYLLQNVIIRQSAYKFYSTLLETMRLSCRPTVLEIERAICRKSPILTYPTCIWRPRWG